MSENNFEGNFSSNFVQKSSSNFEHKMTADYNKVMLGLRISRRQQFLYL